MRNITLHATWVIRAPLTTVFDTITDFNKWPEYFPRVAESIRIIRHNGNDLDMAAKVRSFGRTFPVTMKTKILPGRGFVSDNDSPVFGTSGHEELLLAETPQGTTIDYTYRVTVHNPLLRIIARPLIGWFSMKYWEKTVIGELRKRLER